MSSFGSDVSRSTRRKAKAQYYVAFAQNSPLNVNDRDVETKMMIQMSAHHRLSLQGMRNIVKWFIVSWRKFIDTVTVQENPMSVSWPVTQQGLGFVRQGQGLPSLTLVF